jgi:hypothetical protein
MQRNVIGLSILLLACPLGVHASDQLSDQLAALDQPDCGYVCVFAASVDDQGLDKAALIVRRPDPVADDPRIDRPSLKATALVLPMPQRFR